MAATSVVVNPNDASYSLLAAKDANNNIAMAQMPVDSSGVEKGTATNPMSTADSAAAALLTKLLAAAGGGAPLLDGTGSSPAYLAKVTSRNALLTDAVKSMTLPHDWTEGTGLLGAAGGSGTATITIPAPATLSPPKRRQFFLVQNQSVNQIGVGYGALKADGSTATVATLLLGPGFNPATGQPAAGFPGDSDERGNGAFIPQGPITISGPAGSQIVVLEVTE